MSAFPSASTGAETISSNQVSAKGIDPSRYRNTVARLTSEPVGGRAVGTPGGAEAIRFIEAMYREAGLLPPRKEGGYVQRYRHSDHGEAEAANIIGVLPGNDPVVGHEVVVISAHHDHLGWNSGSGCPEARRGGCMMAGANDNASGTAALVELAFALAARRADLRRTVLFLSIDGEECGCTGSKHYVFNEPLFPLKDTIYNLNIDQIGEGASLVDHTVDTSTSDDHDCEVDGEVFARRGIKAQTLVGDNSNYHQCTDVMANINFQKALQAVHRAYGLVWKAAQD